jgi:hypothetical protein
MSSPEETPMRRNTRRTRTIPRLPKPRSADAMSDELNHVIAILNRRSAIIEEHALMLAALEHEQTIQLRRIADLQAEVDAIKRFVGKLAIV